MRKKKSIYVCIHKEEKTSKFHNHHHHHHQKARGNSLRFDKSGITKHSIGSQGYMRKKFLIKFEFSK